MATDATLLASVRDGAAPALRLYRWAPPCLSFGRNQPARGLYDADRARDLGIDVVRRPTGGLAVLHDDELTYSVAVPAAVMGGPRATYLAINILLVAALRRLGVPADIAGGSAPPVPLAAAPHPPCFEMPAAAEVVADGRKLVGSAQRTEDGTVLQHGSILLAGDQRRVLSLRADRAVAATSRSGRVPLEQEIGAAGHATLAEVLGRAPGWAELADAVTAAFQYDGGIPLAPATLSPVERSYANAVIPRYEDDAWTWRR
jgi:lipoate-protein ligase A